MMSAFFTLTATDEFIVVVIYVDDMLTGSITTISQERIRKCDKTNVIFHAFRFTMDS